jgi:hypothetical protein
MTSAFQLIPNGQQRRTHPLLDRQPQDLKPTASVGTTTVCEAQEVKILRFTQPHFLQFLAAKRPNSISRVFEALSDKPNLAVRGRRSHLPDQ